jgi:hypothetical protein
MMSNYFVFADNSSNVTTEIVSCVDLGSFENMDNQTLVIDGVFSVVTFVCIILSIFFLRKWHSNTLLADISMSSESSQSHGSELQDQSQFGSNEEEFSPNLQYSPYADSIMNEIKPRRSPRAMESYQPPESLDEQEISPNKKH